jgi:hypothetical protein
VVVTCAGFQAAETVDVYWNQLRDSAIVAAFSADGSGKGMASFLAPEIPSGDYAIIIRGRTSARALTVPLEIRAAIFLTPREGDPGDVIDADLTGFQPGETVSIVFVEAEDVSRVLRRVTAGEDGSVTTTFRAPTADTGSYDIEASGQSGATASASFEVT